MASIITVDKIQGLTNGQINLPTGHKIKAIDSGAIIAPGMVVQVVSQTMTDTFGTTVNINTGGSAIPGLGLSITPKFANSKIYITIDANTGSAPSLDQSYFILKRNGSPINISTVASGGVQQNITTRTYTYNDGNIMMPISTSYLDSPATTSSVLYQLYMGTQSGGGTVYINRSNTFRSHVDGSPTASTITLMEIAQ